MVLLNLSVYNPKNDGWDRQRYVSSPTKFQEWQTLASRVLESEVGFTQEGRPITLEEHLLTQARGIARECDCVDTFYITCVDGSIVDSGYSSPTFEDIEGYSSDGDIPFVFSVSLREHSHTVRRTTYIPLD